MLRIDRKKDWGMIKFFTSPKNVVENFVLLIYTECSMECYSEGNLLMVKCVVVSYNLFTCNT